MALCTFVAIVAAWVLYITWREKRAHDEYLARHPRLRREIFRI